MASPTCTVDATATTNGVNVTPAATVTIALASHTGVTTWSISCVYTDETSVAATVTAALTIDSVLKTATFTAPAAGKTYIFRSQVNGGLDSSGAVDASLTTTFGVYTLAANGLRVVAANETTEGSASFGWTVPVNNMIRATGTVTSVSGTAPIVVTGTTTPVVSIDPSSGAAAGSMSAANFTKLGLYPAVSGLTTGQVIRATGAATMAFGALDLANASATTGVLAAASRAAPTTAEAITALNAILPGIQDFRLTLTTAVPITTTDVTSAGTIYLTPYVGNRIALYSGTAWELLSSAEVSLALTVTSGTNYDVFAYNAAGTVTLELTAWATDTTRTTALVLQDGVWCKTGALTRRYLGTIRASGSNVTEDSLLQRYVYNFNHRVPRFGRVQEATNSWAGDAASTWRYANNTSTNIVQFVSGMIDAPVKARAVLMASCATDSATNAGTAIGVDSNTTASGTAFGALMGASQDSFVPVIYPSYAQLVAEYAGYPGLGYHALMWLETSGTAITFYGDNNAPTLRQSGMSVEIGP